MKKEDLQATLEAISKSGIKVAGDLVLEKKVEYEVANVEAGGIGIQINHNSHREDVQQEDASREISPEELARAIESCQEYFWGNSSYAVLFCLQRIRGFLYLLWQLAQRRIWQA